MFQNVTLEMERKMNEIYIISNVQCSVDGDFKNSSKNVSAWRLYDISLFDTIASYTLLFNKFC